MDKEITLKGKLILSGCITTDTGLHIGGLSETLKIGGTDNPVIRDAFGRILIPGSSLKGKIRSLLEHYFRLIDPNPEVEGKVIDSSSNFGDTKKGI